MIDKFFNQFSRLRHSQKGTIKHSGSKLRPNQKCPCESGKKYKKCCQQKLEKIARLRGSYEVSQKDISKF